MAEECLDLIDPNNSDRMFHVSGQDIMAIVVGIMQFIQQYGSEPSQVIYHTCTEKNGTLDFYRDGGYSNGTH